MDQDLKMQDQLLSVSDEEVGQESVLLEEPPVPLPPTKKQLKKTARRFYNSVGFAFIMYYVLAYGISFFVGSLLGVLGMTQMSAAFNNGFNCVVSLVVNLLAFEAYRRRQRIRVSSFCSLDNVTFGDVADGAIVVMGLNGFVSMVLGIVLTLFGEWFGANPTTPDFSLVGDLWADVWMLVSVVVVAPFTEEYIFRGLLQTGFRRYGRAFSIVAPAILFGLLHGNVIQAIPAFVIGVVLGYYTDKTGSIATAVCIHMLNNLISTLLSLSTTPDWIATAVLLTCMGITLLLMIFDKKQGFPRNHSEIPRCLRWGTMITAPAMIVTLLIFAVENISSLI